MKTTTTMRHLLEKVKFPLKIQWILNNDGRLLLFRLDRKKILQEMIKNFARSKAKNFPLNSHEIILSDIYLSQ